MISDETLSEVVVEYPTGVVVMTEVELVVKVLIGVLKIVVSDVVLSNSMDIMLEELLESGSISVVVDILVLVATDVVVAEESTVIELVSLLLVVLSAGIEVDELPCGIDIEMVVKIDDSLNVVGMLMLVVLLYSGSDEMDVDVASGVDVVEGVVEDPVAEVEVMYW